MKLLKKILLVLGAILAIPLIVALFLPTDYFVKRDVVINKSQAEVFDYIKLLKSQEKWSTFILNDPKMTLHYSGTDGAVGGKVTWESDVMGVGEQEITQVMDGSGIAGNLRFKGWMESIAPVALFSEAVNEGSTKVSWQMSGKMHYPMNFLQVFFSMDDMIGAEYAKSLANLKTTLEGQ
ncbi:MAG: SRPBCC family protein [Saprospiraceae bacterium]|nr:SRPBCC family protein [Saprospiraceae bacterium]